MMALRAVLYFWSVVHFVESVQVACIFPGRFQGIQGWFWDAPVVGSGDGVAESLYPCPCTELPYCPVGDRVAVASSAESDSLALPVGVGSVGLAVPTD